MKSTNIKESKIVTIGRNDIPATAQVYAEVFAGLPWQEVSKCNSCGEFGSSQPSERAKCSHCSSGKLSLEAYPDKETQKYIKKELAKMDALGLLAVQMNLSKLIGFGWGYAMDGKQFVKEKYKLAEMQEMINRLLVNMGVFYYVSEVGVVESSQGSGIGKQLTHKLMDHGKHSQGNLVLRTNEDSAMRYIAQKAGMVPVVGLNSGNKDKENEARVIFVSKK